MIIQRSKLQGRHRSGGSCVQNFSERVAAERARWLAELSSALQEARQLATELGASDGQPEAVTLYARIETVRLEIEAMRLKGLARWRPSIDPERTLLWSQVSSVG